MLFTAAEKQPITVLAPYSSLAMSQGSPPDYHSLITGRTAADDVPAPYLPGWAGKFDYVLLLDAGGASRLADFLPDKLELLNQSDMAALFRVRRHATVSLNLESTVSGNPLTPFER